MTKSKSNNLHTLVKSLTSPEKVYLKRFAFSESKGDESLYVRLFTLMEKQEQYDEQQILKGESRIKKKSIHNIQQYLYELILTTLGNFYATKTEEVQLQGLLQKAKLLFSKGLFGHCKKIILKAKGIAYEYEKLNLLLEILELQLLIANKEMDPNAYEMQTEAIFAEQLEVQRKIQLNIKYNAFRIKLFIYASKYNLIRNEAERKKIKSFFETHQPGDESELSYLALYNYYSGCYLYYRLNKAYDNVNTFAEKIIQLTNARPKIRNADPTRYIINTANLIVAQEVAGNFADAKKTLVKLRHVEKEIPSIADSINLKALLFYCYHTALIDVYCKSGDLETVNQQLPEFEKNLKKHEPVLSKTQLLVLYDRVADFYWLNKNYRKVLEWTNRILNEPTEGLLFDAYAKLRVVSLIVHYELGNGPSLDFFIKSTFRFRNKKYKLSATEELLLKYIKKFIDCKSGKELKQLYTELKNKLEALKDDSYEQDVFGGFNLHTWLKSKIENVDYKDVLVKKEV